LFRLDRPFFLEPLFTRDPRRIGGVEVLNAMIAIRGVYERHEVLSLNHGVGFDTASTTINRARHRDPACACPSSVELLLAHNAQNVEIAG
jgi:malonate decarboxylase alpha subunit